MVFSNASSMELVSNRDVRTLLFCRISKNNQVRDKIRAEDVRSHCKLYEEIRNLKLSGNPNASETFFALGSFDALHVYKSPIDANEPTWFQQVYEEKQRIVKNIRTDIVYHQMHLVNNKDSSDFWTDEAKKMPFFLVTCIYGVQHTKPEDTPSPEAQLAYANTSTYCSSYEAVIGEFLNKQNIDKTKIKYVVYNGISISDVIVLWRASELSEILDLIPRIELTGNARKTLSTISFSLGKEGRIRQEVYDSLERMEPKYKLSLSIRGAIRSPAGFVSVRKQLEKILINCQSYQNFGLNDFTIEAEVTGAVIKNLLKLYMDHHDGISDCCWEIHTDLRRKDPNFPWSNAGPKYPTSILFKEYDRFLRISDSLNLDKYPWYHSLRELYATNSNIDRNPVLHGPSYLVYHTLRILNDYISGEVKDFCKKESIKSLLLLSERKLLRFVRSWDQLTEQIIRNDDVILGGRNNSHTVHISLPESALDFYHAFIRAIVAFLVQCDHDRNRKPQKFEYDFLLVPDINTRFSFSQIFVTSTDQKPLLREDEKPQIWPERQAYLLNIPLDSVFSPMDILIPVTHECMHCFGDVLRKRRLRRQYMAVFIATNLISAMNFGGSNYRILHKHISKVVYGNVNGYASFYLDRAAIEMESNAKSLLGIEGSKRIIDKLPSAYFLFSDSALQSSKKISESQAENSGKRYSSIEAVVRVGKYFFKECYADAMTMALLDLDPCEYLKQFRKEIILFDFDNNSGLSENLFHAKAKDNMGAISIIVQRIAIVLAVWEKKKNDFSRFSHKTFPQIIDEIYQWIGDETDKVYQYEKTYRLFAEGIEIVYYSLVDGDKNLEWNQGSGLFMGMTSVRDLLVNFLDVCSPPAALKCVQDYLETTIDEFCKIRTERDHRDESPFILAKDFDSIIRQGNMFGKRFYEYIRDYHKEIRDCISK